MALNKIERKLLETARELIEKGRERYICLALLTACDITRKGEMARYSLSAYIHEQLGEFHTLEHWQNNRGMYRATTQIRRDRLAWIDWMLGKN